VLLPDAAPASLLEFFKTAVVADSELQVQLCEI